MYTMKILSECRTQEWFARFCSENLEVEDEPRSLWPVTGEVDEIIEMSKSRMQAISMLDFWVPHQLSERNLIDRITITEMLP